MYKIVYLPTGEYLKPYLEHVKNEFTSLVEAENAIRNRIVLDMNIPLLQNAMPNPNRYYLNSIDHGSSQDIQQYKYLFEILEV